MEKKPRNGMLQIHLLVDLIELNKKEQQQSKVTEINRCMHQLQTRRICFIEKQKS